MGTLTSRMILALVACLLIPHLVQSTPLEPPQSYDVKEPEFAAVIIGDCDKVRGIEASEVYSPNVKSSVVPASPLDTCTLPAGVFYNDSLILCGGGCQEKGTPCYTNKIGCDTWEQMAPIREYRERFTMTVVESFNALVVVGGFKCTNDVEIFHDGKWCDGPKHDGLHGLVFDSAVSFGKSHVMVIGGLLKGKPTNNVFTIDVSNGKVEKAPCLNFKRHSHASSPASWGGRDYIIVAGGFEDSYTVSNKVEILSMHSRGYVKPTWQMLASMNINRFDFGLAMYGSQLAAFGGQPPIESENIEVYDPETNCWKMVSQCIAHPERQFSLLLQFQILTFKRLLLHLLTLIHPSTLHLPTLIYPSTLVHLNTLKHLSTLVHLNTLKHLSTLVHLPIWNLSQRMKTLPQFWLEGVIMI